MSDAKTAVVIGATGTQGGKAARALSAAGWQVRAPVRDPSSAAAGALSGLGIRTIPGDLDHDGSLAEACSGASAIFAALPPARGTTQEMERAARLARIAVRAGVRQAVYSSVSGTGWRQ